MEFNQNKSLINNYVPFEKAQKEKEMTLVKLLIASKAIDPLKTDIIYIYLLFLLSFLFLADPRGPGVVFCCCSPLALRLLFRDALLQKSLFELLLLSCSLASTRYFFYHRAAVDWIFSLGHMWGFFACLFFGVKYQQISSFWNRPVCLVRTTNHLQSHLNHLCYTFSIQTSADSLDRVYVCYNFQMI